MDLIDKKILCELDSNCRTPISQLARRLRIGRSVAAYRVARLEQEGVISSYICQVNLGALGFRSYKIHLKLRNFAHEEDRFTCAVIKNPHVISFLKTEGSYDYSIVLSVKSTRSLDEFLTFIKSGFRHLIKDYHVSIIVYSKIFKLHKLLLNKPGIKMERFAGESREVSIDDADKAILHCISTRANRSIVDISRKTRLSIDIVNYRLRNLQHSIISSCRVILDLGKMGYFHYVVMLQTRTATKGQEETLITWCSSRHNVLYCTKRIGNFDFEINVAIRDINELNAFLAELKERFGELIDSFEIVLNSRILKLNYVPF